MARNCIAAHTLPGCNYPGFVSINEENGIVEITVRAEANPLSGRCGDCVSLKVPALAWAQMVREAAAYPVTPASKQEA